MKKKKIYQTLTPGEITLFKINVFFYPEYKGQCVKSYYMS
jgi:hypothetical protein